jgi:hypothetical protein
MVKALQGCCMSCFARCMHIIVVFAVAAALQTWARHVLTVVLDGRPLDELHEYELEVTLQVSA